MKHLVSIVIPAYGEKFFAEAFASALAQTYAPLEVVVCDDSPGEAIEEEVVRAGDSRVRYVRNAERLGFQSNFTKGYAEARGEYVKFLNDDDRLRPHCVEVLAGALEANPGVGLAFSRRSVIDAAGQRRPDVGATQPMSLTTTLMAGIALGDHVLSRSTNFIGEPSTVMFRHASVGIEGESIFRWAGHTFHCLADLGLWLRLLSNAGAYYSADPLSEYRIHAGQEQRGASRIACLTERLAIIAPARAAGFLATSLLMRTALGSERAITAAWMERGAPDAQERVALTHLVGEFDREIAAFA